MILMIFRCSRIGDIFGGVHNLFCKTLSIPVLIWLGLSLISARICSAASAWNTFCHVIRVDPVHAESQ